MFLSSALPLQSNASFSLIADMMAPFRHQGTIGSCLSTPLLASLAAASDRERRAGDAGTSVESSAAENVAVTTVGTTASAAVQT